MPRFAPSLLVLLGALQEGHAVESTLTSAGYTGLAITPNAHLIGWGRTEGTYDNQLPGVIQNPTGHNFALGFGLLPNLEISGRLAASELNSSCFVGCGAARDLSANGKFAIGLDANNRFRAAIGATDVGGAVSYFKSYYGVLTFNERTYEASLGLARRTGQGVNGSRQPLDGVFGALAWQPVEPLRAHVEYADGNAWAGVRLFAPKAWLPEGWSLSAGANARLNQNALTERKWWTASLSVPLYKVPALATRRAEPPPQTSAGQGSPVPADAAQQPSPRPLGTEAAPPIQNVDRLKILADALQGKGLEDIFVGRMPDQSIAVRVNNGSYRWNTVDALGAALGALANTFGDSKVAYRLVLTQGGLPMVAVTGQADCLRSWIARLEPTCTGGELTTPGHAPLEQLHQGVQWDVANQNPGWQRVRVTLSPVLRSNVGTELGAFDYSVGLNAAAQLPLWRGAHVRWSQNVPLSNSDDYRPPGVFSQRRVVAATESLVLSQNVRIPVERWLGLDDAATTSHYGLSGLTGQATLGRVGTYFDGVHGSLRWEPGDGRHRVSAQAGLFRNNAYDNGRGVLGSLRTANPLLASYRYSFIPTRTYLEGTAGQFMNNDRGFRIDMRQWFTDVSVSVFYKRTGFSGQAARQLAGLELTVPIGPRQDWQLNRHLQVGGATRFGHSVETVVGSTSNPVLPVQAAALPPLPDQSFNSDRTGLIYFEDNLPRIRDAAR
jgi:hypothetical protein